MFEGLILNLANHHERTERGEHVPRCGNFPIETTSEIAFQGGSSVLFEEWLPQALLARHSSKAIETTSEIAFQGGSSVLFEEWLPQALLARHSSKQDAPVMKGEHKPATRVVHSAIAVRNDRAYCKGTLDD